MIINNIKQSTTTEDYYVIRGWTVVFYDPTHINRDKWSVINRKNIVPKQVRQGRINLFG